MVAFSSSDFNLVTKAQSNCAKYFHNHWVMTLLLALLLPARIWVVNLRIAESMMDAVAEHCSLPVFSFHLGK